MADLDQVILSFASAKKMVAERDELARKLEDANRRVKALAVLLPAELHAYIFGDVPGDVTSAPSTLSTRPQSLVTLIHRVLDDAPRGLTEKELETAVSVHTDLHAILTRDPNAFLEAVHRANRSGRVKRRNGRLFSSFIIARAEEQEGDASLPISSLPRISVISKVEEMLRSAGKIVPIKAIVHVMRSDADTADRVRKNPQIVYSSLSRLAKSGSIVKEGKAYRWVPEAERSPRTASDESENTEADEDRSEQDASTASAESLFS